MVRRRREFWVSLVDEFERSGAKQQEFVAAHGVSVGGFQRWLYRLRREHQALSTQSVKSVRLLPVTVAGAGHRDSLTDFELATAGCVLRFTRDAEPKYVARLVAELRGAAVC